MKIITVLNNKGGVGKTALACILAELLMIDGQRVAVVDLDGQLNAVDHLRRMDGGNVFPAIDVLPFPDKVPDFRALSGYDVVIVDTPPRIEGDNVRAAISAGDLFLVPFTLSRHALFGVERTFELLPDGRPVLPICNGGAARTKDKKELLEKVQAQLGRGAGDLRAVVAVPMYDRVDANLAARRDFFYGLREKEYSQFEPLLKAVQAELMR